MSKRLSVIIVSYNTQDLLQSCLDSLFSRSQDKEAMEVIVVDNASSDDSVPMLRERFPQVHVLAQGTNLGFAAANNLAFAQAQGRYIFLLNPDARIEAGALDSCVQYMQRTPDCGLCGGRILNMDGTPAPSARSYPSVLNKGLVLSSLSAKFPASRICGRPDMTYLAADRAVDVDWVPGTFSCLRRDMLEEIGFFDERYFMYYEETDLCLRANQSEWKVVFLPEARVWHVGGASSKTRKDMTFDSSGSQLLKFRLRSEMLYWRKNFGLGPLVGNIGLEYGFHLLRALKNSVGGGERDGKRQASLHFLNQTHAALRDTAWGRRSPKRPW